MRLMRRFLLPLWFSLRSRPWLCAVLALLAGVCLLILWVATVKVPDFGQFKQHSQSSEAWLLDRHGAPLQRLRLNHDYRRLDWVPLAQISPRLQQAMLVAEDKRFYQHAGVDPWALLSAIWDNLHRPHRRGGSTLTMQLAKLWLQDTQPGFSNTSPWRFKLAQIRLALAIDHDWQKNQILEAYLNRVTFRGELVGIDAAARGLLAKGPAALDRLDAALLAALVRAPAASASRLARRACDVLTHTHTQDARQDCERLWIRSALLPKRPFPMAGQDDAPHVARRLLTQAGQRDRSSLDASLQRFARQTLQTHLAQLASQHVTDGAVLVLDNTSGEVLAYVGSSGDLSGAAAVDGVAALRQPGSTLKPFLYALAIDQGWLQAASVLDDSPLALTTPSGLYIPQDYDRHFHGAVSVRTALASSLNVPAVRALTLVGVDRFLHTLQQLGLQDLKQDADFYGFGLALGGAEASLFQLTNAYRALANGGQWQPVSFHTGTKPLLPSRQVLTPQTSFIIGDILSDPVARSMTFGLSSPLSTRGWAAVKTGTSKGMRDNWAIGYSQRYTIGVWVGNFSGEPMWDVSGVTGAAPVWRDIMEYLHRDSASTPPVPPAGVVAQTVHYVPAIEAPRQEWVLGNAPLPAATTLRLAPLQAQLIAPPAGAVIAPDPDIPDRKQALLVQAAWSGQGCLYLDQHLINQCRLPQLTIPLPPPGKHVLSLRDKHGQLLDQHPFEVRAIALKAPA